MATTVADFYDTISRTFSNPSTLTFGRAYHAAAATGNKIVFAGGRSVVAPPFFFFFLKIDPTETLEDFL